MIKLAQFEPLLSAFLAPFYAKYDTMHDATHVQRVSRRAMAFAERHPCDLNVLRLAAQLHGTLNEHGDEIRQFMTDHGMPKDTIDHLFKVALESEKDGEPQTLEGKLLHDAHLLEGDENFLITKSIATGSARGQSLAETIAYLETHLGAYRCCFPEHQAEYERRIGFARRYVATLKPEL